MRLGNKLEQTLIPAKTDHISRGDIAEHRVRRLEPKSGLIDVAPKIVSYECANVCYLLEPFLEIIGNPIIETDRSLAHATDLGQLVRVEIQEVGDLIVVQLVIGSELQRISLMDVLKQGVLRHGVIEKRMRPRIGRLRVANY